jgi:6-phosphofructokinase 2
LVPEKKLRCSTPEIEPGGGGINVARVLARLGARAIALYPSGGCTGKTLNQLMMKEQVSVIPVESENETRENIIVLETSTNKQFRFTMPAPGLKVKELLEILERMEAIGAIDFIVVSGSLPTSVSPDIFSRIGAIARKKKAKVIVDTSGEALIQAVDQGVYLIKPSLSELASLSGKESLHADKIVYEAREIIEKKNCEIIVVSLNAKGAMLVTKNKNILISPPVVKVQSTVGAGDSMVAGIVFALSKGFDIETAVEYGVACGTAATLNSGTELCHKADTEMLFTQIQLLSGKVVTK